MATRNSKLHDVSPREILDRFAFIIAFVVGVFVGIALKMTGAHPFVAAGFSAIVLVAYALAAWAGGRIKIEPEAIGDNCYYLGFLFTLASLAFTLYQMAEPTTTGGSPVNIPDVISGFGVALSSTIVGVFLRVLMMQMRPDFVAKDRAVRADLNQAYGQFRRTLSGTLSQMKSFSTESIQFAAERDKRLRDATEKYMSDHHEALTETTEELSRLMKTSFSETADMMATRMEESFTEASKTAIEEISASLQNTNKEAQEAIRALVSDIQALKDRLNEQEIQSFEDIENRRRRMAAAMDSSETQLKAHDAAMDGYIKVTRRAADAMTKRIVPALDALQERLDKMSVDAPFNLTEPGPPATPEDIEDAIDKPFTVGVASGGPWQRRTTGSES